MLHIDSHAVRATLTSPYELIEGWFDGQAAELSVLVEGQKTAIQRVLRPDLGDHGTGFRAYLDLTRFTSPLPPALTFEIFAGLQCLGDFPLAVTGELQGRIADAKQAKAHKRAWLLSNLRHWQSGDAATLVGDEIRFAGTDIALPQSGYGALNALNPAFGFDGRIANKKDGVSAHPYPTLLETYLAQERRPGFMALDFGAGLKTIERSDVIYMEVFDYPSSDLLSVGQTLPFADNTFDMVITLAVLEHVDDPFACAREITRVLKPGGLIFSGLPFMQPEHGYPDHYFNATRSGHRRLYGDQVEPVEHLVDDHQHPFLSLQWILRSYLLGLPEEARAALSGMTVDELMRQRFWRSRQEPFVRDLSVEAQWELASATTFVGRKTGHRDGA